MKELNSKIPAGPLAEKWTNYKAHQNLVNPANKRKLDIIVIGVRGLAVGSTKTLDAKTAKHSLTQRCPSPRASGLAIGFP